MFIPYAQNDIIRNPENKSWLQDRLVGCHHERSGIPYSVKKAVVQFGDNYKVQSGPGASAISSVSELAPVKHHVPICKALYTNMIKRGTESGEGMTREQSIQYLEWVLDKLQSREGFEGGGTLSIYDFEPPIPRKPGMREKFRDGADLSRKDYEQWVSWAVGLICDWPENLFCGESSGDGNGKKTDWPTRSATSDRVRKAAEIMRYFIYDLSIGPYHIHNEPTNELFATNLITDETYEPDPLGDESWLPYTYEEQEEYAAKSRVPIGSDIIEDSQDLPIDFTGSQ
ncbi:hypothetical protein J7T55_008620 [Diaporthe amygdali]|uniref:uncharacterized protein n=1 Tax=Phomopsis amygdali TaxID=1214568 RepID=UPI0022FDB52E|nr:uncharacterized protein J7T55_008620 [Diaporthe amygdali]KAJ0121456.1 hypothetical protein J7T55_008620 [Diaporthe amygdali]